MDRIRLNCKKYRLCGASERWKTYREQAILDLKEHWKTHQKYYEPSGTADYFQLYDAWDQNDIYNGWCRFVVDAGDERFTIGHVWEPDTNASSIYLDDFDELIKYWREKLHDPTISLTPMEPSSDTE
jgi:hypothetical protein